MALIKCPHCGSQVSDKAHRCPKCGKLVNNPEVKQESPAKTPLTPPVVNQQEPTEDTTYDYDNEIDESHGSRRKWLIITAAAIVMAIIAGVLLYNSHSNAVEAERMAAAAEQARQDSIAAAEQARQDSIEAARANRITPDLTLFEVKGMVKSIDYTNAVMPLSMKSVNFDEDGNWVNYSALNDFDKYPHDSQYVKISRDGSGHISNIKVTTDSNDPDDQEQAMLSGWEYGLDWKLNKLSNVGVSIHEGGQEFDLIYTDDNLTRLDCISFDFGDADIVVYKLRGSKYDDKGNWIERTWMKRTEDCPEYTEDYLYIKPEFHGVRYKVTRVDSIQVTEKRKITYYE